MQGEKGAEVRKQPRRPLSVARVDRKYQRGIGRLLGEVAREYREGKIDGLHVVIVRPNNGGQDHYQVAMRDYQIVWAANAMILDTMLVKD